MRTFCVECGFNVKVDQDGCCVTCGSPAHGAAIEKLNDIFDWLDDIERETRYKDMNASDWAVAAKTIMERGMDHLNHSCGGTWEPILGWSSRYRCDKCHAIGYRNAAAPKGETARENIKPYRCQKKGCNGFAVAMKPQRCMHHQG